MKIFITAHRKRRLNAFMALVVTGGFVIVKAVLLASEGCSSGMIVQALRFHQTRVDHHISESLNTGKPKPENGASNSQRISGQTCI